MADDFNPVRKHADFNWFADSVAFAVNCIAEAFLLPFVFASAPGKNTVAGETAKKEAAAPFRLHALSQSSISAKSSSPL